MTDLRSLSAKAVDSRDEPAEVFCTILHECSVALNEAADEIARLRAAVDRDKTGLAAGLSAVRQRLAGSSWLGDADDWGNYEYDERTEDNLRREFAGCLAEADKIAADALRASGTLATATLRNEPSEIDRLQAENADLLFAFRVQIGKVTARTEEECAAVSRAFKKARKP